jgi:CHASE1-domain containing sensor protein
MTKKSISGIVAGSGTIAISAWLPWVAVLVLGVVLLLTVMVTVVVLTAARGRDVRQQHNSTIVLDRLLAATFRKLPPDP